MSFDQHNLGCDKFVVNRNHFGYIVLTAAAEGTRSEVHALRALFGLKPDIDVSSQSIVV